MSLREPGSRNEDECVKELACAVVRQAFFDLGLTTGITEEERQDAFEFLTDRLWERDTFWKQVITLPKTTIIEEARRRLSAHVTTAANKTARSV